MSRRALRKDPSTARTGRPTAPARLLWAAWLAGLAQVLALVTFSIWCLASPPVFERYYPRLGIVTEPADALAIVRWLSTEETLGQLETRMVHGTLSEEEILHYADVRRWLRLLPWAWGVTGGVLLLGWWGCEPSRRWLEATQWRAFWFMAIGLTAGALFAWWDWRIFFAWVHHPFFGATSWVFPWSAYSLQLFPASFWQWMGGVVVAAPMGMTLLLLGLFRVGRRN